MQPVEEGSASTMVAATDENAGDEDNKGAPEVSSKLDDMVSEEEEEDDEEINED